MIRSHSAWHSSNPTKWSVAQEHYQAHLTKIAPDLPPALARFARHFTLHDDRIAQVNVVVIVPSKRDALVTITIFRDGCHGTAALLVLHLIGLRGMPRKIPPHSNIMFFDVEVLSASVFQLSFALEERKTWNVKFRDFGCYLHDYHGANPGVRTRQVISSEHRTNNLRP